MAVKHGLAVTKVCILLIHIKCGQKDYALYLPLYSSPVKFISIKTGLKLQNHTITLSPLPTLKSEVMRKKITIYQNVQ